MNTNCFCFLVIVTDTAMNACVPVFVRHVFSALSVANLRVELGDPTRTCQPVFHSSRTVPHPADSTPTARPHDSTCGTGFPTASPTLGTIPPFHSPRPGGREAGSHRSCDFTSLTADAERLLTGSSAVCMSFFGQMSIQILHPFKNWVIRLFITE